MASAPLKRGRPHVDPRGVLVALFLAGIALRVIAEVSWWPASPTLEDGYQLYAANPLLDPLHPAGYGLIVGLLGDITRQIAFTILVQHAVGLVSALLLAAATRRVTGSRWAGLLPAAVLLLDPDVIFLEQSVMSETWAILSIVLSLYAAVRSGEAPEPWWRWPLLCGAALAAAVIIRTASLPLVAVVALSVLAWGEGPVRRRGRHLGAALALTGSCAVLLLGFAALNAADGERFGITPTPGWYLYGRVAQIAECRDFTPPPGTAGLCQTLAPDQRPSGYLYTFGNARQSPAIRRFGGFGADDGVVGAWARHALLAQPGDFLALAWIYLRSYYVPSTLPAHIRATSTELNPQLDFLSPGNAFYVAAMHQALEKYYDRFTVHPWHGGLVLLHALSHVTRFGATMLFVTTILVLIGLLTGTRRSRIGVLLFGAGGLSLLLLPVLTGDYSGRYTVPMAGPMVAAAAIALTAIGRTRLGDSRTRKGGLRTV